MDQRRGSGRVSAPPAGLLQLQQREVLADGHAVLITQEVAADSERDAPPGERQEAVEPLCCHLEVAERRTWSCRAEGIRQKTC